MFLVRFVFVFVLDASASSSLALRPCRGDLPSAACPPHPDSDHHHHLHHHPPSPRRSLLSVFTHLVQHTAVSKLVVASFVLLLLYTLVRIASLVLHEDLLLLGPGRFLSVYVDTLSVLGNETSADVRRTADAYQQTVRQIYESHMHGQLLDIQRVIDFFNNGKCSLRVDGFLYPVSILPFTSKPIESLVKRQLTEHLDTNSRFSSHQSAYTMHNSTETVLLSIHDYRVPAIGHQ